MNKKQYGLVLALAVWAGLAGEAISNQLTQLGLMPQFLQPRYSQARKGFEVVDNRGKRRVLLDKFGLSFFDEEGRPQITLNAQGLDLTMYDQGLNTRLLLSARGPCVIRFSQGGPPRAELLALVIPAEGPKLGCGEKDGKVIWQVPPTP